MRILDINDVELQESDIDEEVGYLQPDKFFVAHHDAIEYQPREWRYWPETYYFEDNTRYTVVDDNDPHVVIKDPTKCAFEWNALEGEEEKVVRGIDAFEQELRPEIFAEDAWDEYEDILRYIEYTQEELDERAAAKAKKEREEAFIENGPDTLDELVDTTAIIDETVEDLVLMVADMIGGAEEEEEEVKE